MRGFAVITDCSVVLTSLYLVSYWEGDYAWLRLYYIETGLGTAVLVSVERKLLTSCAEFEIEHGFENKCAMTIVLWLCFTLKRWWSMWFMHNSDELKCDSALI